MIIKEWLEQLSEQKSTSEEEWGKMQFFLRRSNIAPKARVVYGVVYLEGYGPPMSIQHAAKMVLANNVNQSK